jgi:hypothetical protein
MLSNPPNFKGGVEVREIHKMTVSQRQFLLRNEHTFLFLWKTPTAEFYSSQSPRSIGGLLLLGFIPICKYCVCVVRVVNICLCEATSSTS